MGDNSKWYTSRVWKRGFTEVAAFIGFLSLDENLVELLLRLDIELDPLVSEHHSQTHSQHMLPRICNWANQFLSHTIVQFN